jgi:hypothetical protein
MNTNELRNRCAKWKARKAKRPTPQFIPRSDTAILEQLSQDEKQKLIDIVNEFGRQWDWSLEENGMVEIPRPDYEEYTMELLEMDMAFIGKKLKHLDFDGWLFAILVEQGGTKWAATIFSRLGQNPKGRQWVSWKLNPDLVRILKGGECQP